MISDRILRQYKDWFISYTEKYLDLSDIYKDNILVKIEHTYRVIEEIIELSKYLNLSTEEKNLAETIALFHDIGRFEQYSKYRTFSDKRSENHSIMGVNELINHKVLKDLKQSQQEFIYRCILNHNKASLSPNETPKTLLFSKLIRDADKLDVYNLLLKYYEGKNIKRNSSMELELPNTKGFNYSIYNNIMSGKIVLFSDLENLNDFKLLIIGWIFDINFQYSFQKIKEKEYIPRLLKLLPISVEISDISHKLDNYLNQKLRKPA